MWESSHSLQRERLGVSWAGLKASYADFSDLEALSAFGRPIRSGLPKGLEGSLLG